MEIVAIADTHGYLPKIPKCDILLIGGDICPLAQDRDPDYCLKWLDGPFRNWLSEQNAKHIVGIAGNHDFVFESNRIGVAELHLPWKYLEGASVSVMGLHIYGMPWVPKLKAWAFYADEEALRQHYHEVPHTAQIVLSHGPPLGYGDRCYDGRQVGADPANDMLRRVKPQLFVCGHIHEGFGMYRHPSGTEVVNVSWVDENYEPTHCIVRVDW